MKKEYSKNISDAVVSCLREDGWHFSFEEEKGMVQFTLNIRGRMKKVSFIVDVKEDEYIVYAVAPMGVDESDEKMMASMAEFICRANYGLKNGNFELDMRDGEIRYKCFVDCEGIVPTKEMVRNSILCPGAMMQRYSDGIIDVIFGLLTAKEAVEKCEKSPMEELCALLGSKLSGDGDIDVDEVIEKLKQLSASMGIKAGSDGDEVEADGGDGDDTDKNNDMYEGGDDDADTSVGHGGVKADKKAEAAGSGTSSGCTGGIRTKLFRSKGGAA